MGVGVGVRVSVTVGEVVGVKDRVGVGVSVRVRVSVTVGERVGVNVRVKVTVGVRVGVRVIVRVGVCVSVLVGVGVGVMVIVIGVQPNVCTIWLKTSDSAAGSNSGGGVGKKLPGSPECRMNTILTHTLPFTAE